MKYGYWEEQCGDNDYIITNNNHIELYKCKCICGKIKYVNKYNLKTGRSTNCGCIRKQKLSSKSIDLTNKKFGRLTVIERVLPNSNNNKVRWKCKCDCGNVITVLANSLMTNHTESCGCIISRYPSKIKKILKEEYNIDSILEYYVDIRNENKDIKYFRFDVFIPKYNTAIEYDGEGHYTPINFSGNVDRSNDEFIKTKRNDDIKNNYCKNKNIKLFRIPYTEKNNINLIIKEIINSTYND